MLGKLLKHEFQATSVFLYPAYGAAIASALLNRLILGSADVDAWGSFGAMIYGLLVALYIMSIFVVVILTLAQIIRRFHSNVLGAEGYVTNALPVTLRSLIWAKVIPASVWMLAGLLVIGISERIMGTDNWVVESFPFFDLGLLFTFFRHEGIVLALSILTGIATLVMTILSIYSALSIGHLMRKGRLLWALLIFMGMGFALSSLFMMVLTIVSQIGPITHILLAGGTTAEVVSFSTVFLGTVIQVIAHYAITREILRNKLNLV